MRWSDFLLFVAAGVTSGLVVWYLTEKKVQSETRACACTPQRSC